MIDIVKLLPVGEENAIPSKQLADMCEFTSVRELQKTIESLRCNGEIIASTCQNGGGYFIPGNEMELRAFVRTLENRAKNTIRSLGSAKQALREYERENA